MRNRSQSWIGGHPRAARTSWQLAMLLFFLPAYLAAQGSAHTPSGEFILFRVSETYRKASSYQFAGTLRRTWMVGLDPRMAEMYFQVAASGDGRYKLQSGLGMSKVLAISDGKTISIYSAEDQKYAVREGWDLAGSIRSSLGDAAASLLLAAWNVASRYENLPERAVQIELVDAEGAVTARFNVAVLPTLVVIDREGVIQNSLSGLVDTVRVEEILRELGVVKR